MRIALISTCAVSVPPKAYGGTELVVAELAKRLTQRGHDVMVFATGDSTPEATLRSHFATPVWPPRDMADVQHSAYAWKSIMAEDSPFDVVHAHQAPAVAFSVVCPRPTVLTIHHERVDDLVSYYRDFPDVTYVAISQRQAELVPELDVNHVVHHGLDVDQYELGDGAGGYLAFVGRFAKEKGAHHAIDVALASGVPLRMGGKPHWVNEAYFEKEVKPRLARAGDRVEWLGEVSFGPKAELLRGARATLFPIEWEEPFGLVMIESMLVGTPVVAFARGAASEVVDDGVTGFLVEDEAQMLERLKRIGSIDRARCREKARARWCSMRMARDYEKVYADAIRRRSNSGVELVEKARPVEGAGVRTQQRRGRGR